LGVVHPLSRITVRATKAIPRAHRRAGRPGGPGGDRHLPERRDGHQERRGRTERAGPEHHAGRLAHGQRWDGAGG